MSVLVTVKGFAFENIGEESGGAADYYGAAGCCTDEEVFETFIHAASYSTHFVEIHFNIHYHFFSHFDYPLSLKFLFSAVYTRAGILLRDGLEVCEIWVEENFLWAANMERRGKILCK